MNSPAITEVSVQLGKENLLNEFLGLWFDGMPHVIGSGIAATSGVFPAADIKFGQGLIKQPLDTTSMDPNAPNIEIRLTTIPRGDREDRTLHPVTREPVIQVTRDEILNFWIRAKAQGVGASRFQARLVVDLLGAVLGNPMARLPLAPKGIVHLDPKGGTEVNQTDYSEWMIPVNAQIQYYKIANPISAGP